MEINALFDCLITDVYLTLERHRPADWNFGEYPPRMSAGLLYITGGTFLITENGEKRIHKTHELVYIPRGTKYSVHAADDQPLDFFISNFDLADGAIFPIKRALSLAGCECEDRILRCFQEMANASLAQESFYHIKCRALIYSILYDAARVQQKSAEIGDSRVYAAIRYMRDHLNQPISIGDAAQSVGLSTTHFRRLFEEETGKTPRDYLQLLRIQRAKVLLCGGANTIGEVAEMTGFSDIYYFSRAFKRETGCTPSRWRQLGDL